MANHCLWHVYACVVSVHNSFLSFNKKIGGMAHVDELSSVISIDKSFIKHPKSTFLVRGRCEVFRGDQGGHLANSLGGGQAVNSRPSMEYVYIYIYLCVCACVCAYHVNQIYVYLSIYLTIYLSFYLSIYLSIWLNDIHWHHESSTNMYRISWNNVWLNRNSWLVMDVNGI